MIARTLPLVLAALVLTGCASASGAMIPAPVQQLAASDGYIADGKAVRVTDETPAVSGLTQELRDALLAANDAAIAERGTEITLVSGWRSERYQQSLFDDAVINYGSESEARRWVKLPADSKHVSGEAVDVATADAMDWLSRFGGAYGLCQVYANEAWHFELTADAAGVCPPMLSDSAG